MSLGTPSGGGPFDGSIPGRGYPVSGKIMLTAVAVLFGVVIIMILLHLYARWYLSRYRRRHNLRRRRQRLAHLLFYIESNSSAAAAANRGLDGSLLKTIPTFTYTGEEAEDGLDCAVCLSAFQEGEAGRHLPKCKHSFHAECIDMWFSSHSTCPLCRSPVEAEWPPKLATQGETMPADAVVVEISTSGAGRMTGHGRELCPECANDSSPARVEEDAGGPDPSPVPLPAPIWARRNGVDLVGVSIKVPGRSESWSNSDETGLSSPASQGLMSPIRSLKNMLSRGKRPLPSPGSGTSRAAVAPEPAEVDVEQGRAEEAHGS